MNETYQYFDARVFEGPDRETVACEFVETIQAAHPAEYPMQIGVDAVTVDLTAWLETEGFPERVWLRFRERSVTVHD